MARWGVHSRAFATLMVALALTTPSCAGERSSTSEEVVVDMPPATRRLESAAAPPGAVQAENSAGRAAYFPPCPPSGTHHYRFTVYALSRPTGLHEGAALGNALREIESAATARGRLVGTYARQR